MRMIIKEEGRGKMLNNAIRLHKIINHGVKK